MTDSVNPTSNVDDEDDFYDEASSLFPKAEHLAPSIPPKFGDGRLVAIWPTSQGTRTSKTDNKPYPYVETVTVVLDDGPDGNLSGPGWAEEAAEIVPAVGDGEPVRLDKFQHSTSGLVARLEKRLTGKHPKTKTPLRFRPMIGRMNTRASANNKNVAAYSVAEMTDGDRVIAEKHKAYIIAINKELEAGEKDAENASAFDV